MDSLTPLLELSRSAGRLDLEEVPAATREHAVRVIADTIGVAMGGARQPEISAFVAGEPPLFPGISDGAAHVLTPALPRAAPITAAFVNATAGTFLEMDEGYRPTGHPGMHIVPAALASAEALHASGKELVAAVLGGYEVTARLFEAFRFTYPFHPHGHVGAVGAAVAVARLRRVDAAEPAAIASTLPLLTVWQPCMEGATARNAWTGAASAIGVLSNRMALSGFVGSREAPRESFGGLVGELARPEALVEPVRPDTLRITGNYFKLHSACALAQSALDAVLALAPPADRVERVEVETISNNMKIAGQARPNDLSRRFSIPYGVAMAIVHGSAAPAIYGTDERVDSLAERVDVRVAEDLDALWPAAMPVRVTVHVGGETRSERVDNPRGHHANPPTPTDLRQKFEMLAARPDAGALYDRLLGLQEVDDVATIFGDLAP